MTPHEQRCADIALWAANDWLKPVQVALQHPQDEKPCQVCGQSFVGNRRRLVCSQECFEAKERQRQIQYRKQGVS